VAGGTHVKIGCRVPHPWISKGAVLSFSFLVVLFPFLRHTPATMPGFFRRLGDILWMSLLPLPAVSDMGQRVFWLITLVAPTAAAITGRLSSQNAVLISAAIGVVLFGRTAYRLKADLDAINDSAPRLIFKGFSSCARKIHDGGSTVWGTPTFYYVNLANEPLGTNNRSTAKQVVGHFTFCIDGKAVAPERVHRWEDAIDPLMAGHQADRFLPRDIPPNGLKCNLDLVLKYDDDDAFYTHDNATGRSFRDFRDPAFKFEKGTYVVTIRLEGDNLQQTYQCEIVNDGKHCPLKVRLLPNMTS
jgi:hypothetical protein